MPSRATAPEFLEGRASCARPVNNATDATRPTATVKLAGGGARAGSPGRPRLGRTEARAEPNRDPCQLDPTSAPAAIEGASDPASFTRAMRPVPDGTARRAAGAQGVEDIGTAEANARRAGRRRGRCANKTETPSG